MPRRAIISLLIALVGTLTASAASSGIETSKHRFQPGRSLQPAVLKPAATSLLRPSARRVQPGVKRPVARQLGNGRATILRPAANAVSLAAVGRQP